MLIERVVLSASSCEEISGKQTAEQILLVAKQSDRCYKHLLKLCTRITIHNLSFCIS